MQQLPVRKSTRLREYSYSTPGMYFVTICCAGRRPLFGSEEAKRVAEECWIDLPRHFRHLELDEWVVMPNHVHGILVVQDPEMGGARHASPLLENQALAPKLGTAVGSYKSAVARRLRLICAHIGAIWQRNYYEHVIRDEPELRRVRQYICENPLTWNEDPYFTGNDVLPKL